MLRDGVVLMDEHAVHVGEPAFDVVTLSHVHSLEAPGDAHLTVLRRS